MQYLKTGKPRWAKNMGDGMRILLVRNCKASRKPTPYYLYFLDFEDNVHTWFHISANSKKENLHLAISNMHLFTDHKLVEEHTLQCQDIPCDGVDYLHATSVSPLHWKLTVHRKTGDVVVHVEVKFENKKPKLLVQEE